MGGEKRLMNIVNRILMILAALVILAFGIISFLLLSNIITPSGSFFINTLALYYAWLTLLQLRGVSSTALQVIAVVIGLVGLMLLILELIPFRRGEAKEYIVHQDPLGDVTVSRSMIRDLVEHEAVAVPGVTQVLNDPEVKSSPTGLRVSTRAVLAWDANAPGVGQQLQERIKESIQSHLGLPVAEVSVATQAAPPVRPSGRRVE
jgi:uncharacterized membrane protein YuzA (DUF378 family)